MLFLSCNIFTTVDLSSPDMDIHIGDLHSTIVGELSYSLDTYLLPFHQIERSRLFSTCSTEFWFTRMQLTMHVISVLNSTACLRLLRRQGRMNIDGLASWRKTSLKLLQEGQPSF
jgi:hypothetical protein